MLAALNHPNICAIYGLEEADGIRFLILELVEGETLAERDTRSPRALTPGFPSPKRSRSRGRSPKPSRRRTKRASSTAI